MFKHVEKLKWFYSEHLYLPPKFDFYRQLYFLIIHCLSVHPQSDLLKHTSDHALKPSVAFYCPENKIQILAQGLPGPVWDGCFLLSSSPRAMPLSLPCSAATQCIFLLLNRASHYSISWPLQRNLLAPSPHRPDFHSSSRSWTLPTQGIVSWPPLCLTRSQQPASLSPSLRTS